LWHIFCLSDSGIANVGVGTMYNDIIGTQQILITLAFLGVMIALLVILRRKSVVIRANLKSGKRIDVIEDRAVSPTERLRIVAVDQREFVMLSAKGQAPQLVALDVKETAIQMPSVVEAPHALSTDPDTASAASVAPPKFPSDAERAAFAAKFEQWRQADATR
jgi:flagellar biogenesis protein FliO